MKNTVAIMYDFDKTLSTTDMQEYTFIPSLGMKCDEFWKQSDELAKTNQMDHILSTMLLMQRKAEEKHIPFTRDYLVSCGKDVVFNDGVEDWFERINAFGKEIGLNIKHYIISCGLKPIIEGCKIAHNFSNIFACDYVYDEKGNAVWPSMAINYSSKLQFLFRINKGVEDISEHKKLNIHMRDELRPIPQSNMIYVGDGMTDVPIMKITRQCGGHSLGVFFDDSQSDYLVEDERVDFYVKADYSENSAMDVAMRAILKELAARCEVERLESQSKILRKKAG